MKIKSLVMTLFLSLFLTIPVNAGKHWVATWATAEQVVEPHNCPPAPYLENNSIRQIVQVSISGKSGSAIVRRGEMAEYVAPMAKAYLEQSGLMNPAVSVVKGGHMAGWC